MKPFTSQGSKNISKTKTTDIKLSLTAKKDPLKKPIILLQLTLEISKAGKWTNSTKNASIEKFSKHMSALKLKNIVIL